MGDCVRLDGGFDMAKRGGDLGWGTSRAHLRPRSIHEITARSHDG